MNKVLIFTLYYWQVIIFRTPVQFAKIHNVGRNTTEKPKQQNKKEKSCFQGTNTLACHLTVNAYLIIETLKFLTFYPLAHQVTKSITIRDFQYDCNQALLGVGNVYAYIEFIDVATMSKLHM